ETEQLDAYRLDLETRSYVPTQPDERGDYPVAALQLHLGLRPGKISLYEGNFLRWIDAAGQPLLIAREQLEQERQRADSERQRAEDAERRLRELEAARGSRER